MSIRKKDNQRLFIPDIFRENPSRGFHDRIGQEISVKKAFVRTERSRMR